MLGVPDIVADSVVVWLRLWVILEVLVGVCDLVELRVPVFEGLCVRVIVAVCVLD